jgi:hypothetical protein
MRSQVSSLRARDWNERAMQRTGSNWTERQPNSWTERKQSGWTTVAFDFDRDGRFDAYEVISDDLLNQARQSSARRMRDYGRQAANSGDFRSYQLDNREWTTVCCDHNGDKKFDRREYLHKDDLKRTRSANEEQIRRHGRSSATTWRATPTSNEWSERQRPQPNQAIRRQQATLSLSGEVRERRVVRLRGINQPQAAVTIRNNDGTRARVVLGDLEKVRRLGISNGDRISILGVRGHINRRDVIFAEAIRAGDLTLNVRKNRSPRTHIVPITISRIESFTERRRQTSNEGYAREQRRASRTRE